ncbi:hypothetical protein, partial [Gordonia sihwensis]|uniref:hypothetical protein n=1 Tax=Gordonia sihwensis TaxID=173559 RepID=UPI0005EF62A0
MAEKTETQRREDSLDAERVQAIKAMLERPGGEAEVAKRYGKNAVASDEAAAARRQIQRERAR